MSVCFLIRPEQASLLALFECTFLSEKPKCSPSNWLCGGRSGWASIVIDCEYQLRGERKVFVSDWKLDDFVPAVCHKAMVEKPCGQVGRVTLNEYTLTRSDLEKPCALSERVCSRACCLPIAGIRHRGRTACCVRLHISRVAILIQEA